MHLYRIFLWSEMPFMLQMGSSNQLMFVLLLVCPLHGSEDLCHQKSVTASAELNIYLIKIVALQKMVFFFLCTGIRISNHYENWKRTCAVVLLTLLHYQRRRYCLIEESKFKYRNRMGKGDYPQLKQKPNHQKTHTKVYPNLLGKELHWNFIFIW